MYYQLQMFSFVFFLISFVFMKNVFCRKSLEYELHENNLIIFHSAILIIDSVTEDGSQKLQRCGIPNIVSYQGRIVNY